MVFILILLVIILLVTNLYILLINPGQVILGSGEDYQSIIRLMFPEIRQDDIDEVYSGSGSLDQVLYKIYNLIPQEVEVSSELIDLDFLSQLRSANKVLIYNPSNYSDIVSKVREATSADIVYQVSSRSEIIGTQMDLVVILDAFKSSNTSKLLSIIASRLSNTGQVVLQDYDYTPSNADTIWLRLKCLYIRILDKGLSEEDLIHQLDSLSYPGLRSNASWENLLSSYGIYQMSRYEGIRFTGIYSADYAEGSGYDRAKSYEISKVFGFLGKKLLSSLNKQATSYMDLLYLIYIRLDKQPKARWSTGVSRGRIKRLVPFLPEVANSYADIGAGDCSITRSIAQEVKAEHIYAVDIENFCQYQDITNIIVQDTQSMDLHDLDLVTTLYSLHHMRDPEYRVKDIYSSLAQGGLLIVQDHNITTDREEEIVVFEHICYKVLEINPGYSKDQFLEYFRNYKEHDYYEYHSSEYWEQMILDTGFEKILDKHTNNYTKVYIASYRKL